MRIALVSQEYPPQTAHGGIATQTHAKAMAMSRLGHDVHVISHSVDDNRHEYQDGGVQVVRIPGYDSHLPLTSEAARWITYSTLVATELARLQARVSIDIVDFPDWGGEGFMHLLNRSRPSAAAVVHLQGPLVMLANTIGWPEHDSPLFRVGTLMEGTSLRLADAVVSSSRCSAQWCTEQYGIDMSSVPVIHAGVDTTTFVPRVPPADEPLTVVFAGRVAESKGICVLLDAIGNLAKSGTRATLRVLGRVEQQFAQSLRKRARENGCEDLLHLKGFVPRDRLPYELGLGHIFAAPSRYEGGPGFAWLEAMACGLPAIACTGSGVAEVITHDYNGLLVPPDNVSALSDALASLVDPVRRARLGKNARQYAVEHADAGACARRLESFYLRVIEEAR